MPDNEWIKSPG